MYHKYIFYDVCFQNTELCEKYFKRVFNYISRAPSVLVLDDLNNVDNKTVLKILTQFLEILDVSLILYYFY